MATCGSKSPGAQIAVLTQNLCRATTARLAPKLLSRQLGLRIQAFAIVEQNGRKSVAETSMTAFDQGRIKAVASPPVDVYFEGSPALRLFTSIRSRSALIENEIGRYVP